MPQKARSKFIPRGNEKESMKDILKRMKPQVAKETNLALRGGLKSILKKDKKKKDR